ncbi:hypothetical protein B0H19DRAFT_1270223 [Mycena capillaripes]|nr:hypothetical protein B0H19DRAFT_1270223 [Mycena capillaripes]
MILAWNAPSWKEVGPSSSALTLYQSEDGAAEDAGKTLLPNHDTAQRQTPLQRNSLRLLWLVLHIGLVVLHLVVLVIGAKGLEHRAVFSVKNQATISFAVTVLSTGIGIAYFSTAVFVTQRLAMHHILRTHQTMTSVHDNVTAWNGLGSALATLYRQFEIPLSVFGPLVVTAYLAAVSILHITTPAIVSVAGFNASVPVIVETLGIPDFNASADITATGLFVDLALTFFPWIDNLDKSQKIGLFNGSLHDTLQDVLPGRGGGRITATGFNITCGYLHGVSNGINVDSGQWNISLGSAGSFETEALLTSSGPNIITASFMEQPLNSSLILCFGY